ncbi:MAG: dynamin family protein, partial [Alicyclobacillus sp.]|nr:dynamin family protein [Alicyclobacillus sp.]
ARMAQVLQALQADLTARGDSQTAQRLADLTARAAAADERVHVAFCGLFSAGKSSLINALTGSAERATGAVPTTATVASCVWQSPLGPVVLLDTPGIDSTDAAHQAATEAALHRADVVVMVADYQHVEADELLDWAYALQESGKPLIWVVHQIDKHLDGELSFADYQARIEQSLADFGLEGLTVLYTAVRPSPYNQLSELREHLARLAVQAPATAGLRLAERAGELLQQHAAAVYGPRLTEAAERVAALAGEQPADPAAAVALRQRLVEALQQWQTEQEAAQQALRQTMETRRSEWLRKIELAQIAPYSTAERGRRYIESLRPDFRMGWFGWRQRTEQERAQRLAAFAQDLAEHTHNFLVLPMQNELRAWLLENGWAQAERLAAVDALTADVTPSWCASLVRTGAVGSEVYGHQYVREVVAAVKSQVAGRCSQLVDDWTEQALAERAQANAAQTAAADRWRAALAALQDWQACWDEQAQWLASWHARLLSAAGAQEEVRAS